MPGSQLTFSFGEVVPHEKAPVPAMRASDIVGTGPWSYGWGGSVGGWWPVIREPFTGAWQKNQEIRGDGLLSNVTQFRCLSLISGDIAKMRMRLIREVSAGVWEEDSNSAWTPVIRKPNRYQNRIQFFENWMLSKLTAGNTYALKERDDRNVVAKLYILDPRRVRPLVADDGEVFYDLYSDNLAGIEQQTIVPASEIIHDRWNCMFHPLIGLSPVFANALTTNQGLAIQQHAVQFFNNGANPGGLLTGEKPIDPDTAERFRTEWQTKFSGPNIGRIAILGGGLKFEKLGMSALDAQLIDQLRWTSEMICASYGVPAYKAGAAPAPNLQNIEALERQYYQACLQRHIEEIELGIDEGLGLPANWGVEFDLDQLLRMDTANMIKAMGEGVGAGIFKVDEARQRLGYGPVDGGDTPYLQQQNYSLAALAKRDASDDPFASNGGNGNGGTRPAPAEPPAPAADPEAIDGAALVTALRAKFAELRHAA